MGRPRSETVEVRYRPGRVKPWEARYWVTEDGKRKPVSKFFTTEADAHTMKVQQDSVTAAERERRVQAGAKFAAAAHAGAKADRRFGAFVEEWFRTVITRRKASTRNSYRQVMDTHILPTLGAIELADETFGVQQITEMLTVRAEAGVTWGTQKVIIRVVSSALTYAVHCRRLRANPALKLAAFLKDTNATDYDDPEPNPLTPTQFDAFIHWLETGAVKGNPDRPIDGPKLRGGQLRTKGYPEWADYFLSLGLTGTRRGEAAAMKISEVKFHHVVLENGKPCQKPTAWVNFSHSPAEQKEKGGDGNVKPKTKRGKRPIELSPEVVTVWQRIIAVRKTELLAAGKHDGYLWVMRGKRITSNHQTAERVFDRAMKALGIDHEGHTIQSLRDTFATMHLMRGTPLIWVSAQLGHAQRSTTLNKYSKWMPDGTGQTFAGAIDRSTRVEEKGVTATGGKSS
jgi:integrase